MELFYAYPGRGFGWKFRRWAQAGELRPYGSWGNGSAMRVSPVALAFETWDEVMQHAADSAAATHDHPDAILGAQATAAAVFLARTGSSREEIRQVMEERFGYDLSEPVESVRRWYRFDPSCSGTVPFALRAFLESESYEDAIRKAIALGGDSDTLACIAGSVSGVFHGVPDPIRTEALTRLDEPLRDIIRRLRPASAGSDPADQARTVSRAALEVSRNRILGCCSCM